MLDARRLPDDVGVQGLTATLDDRHHRQSMSHAVAALRLSICLRRGVLETTILFQTPAAKHILVQKQGENPTKASLLSHGQSSLCYSVVNSPFIRIPYNPHIIPFEGILTMALMGYELA